MTWKKGISTLIYSIHIPTIYYIYDKITTLMFCVLISQRYLMTLQLWLLIISSIPFLKSFLQLMPNKTSILVKNGTTFRSEQINAHMTNQWQMWMFTTTSQENTCYGYDTYIYIYQNWYQVFQVNIATARCICEPVRITPNPICVSIFKIWYPCDAIATTGRYYIWQSLNAIYSL